MSRRNINDLPLPAAKYRIDLLATTGRYAFETARSVDKEDMTRARLARAAPLSKKQYAKAQMLAKRLEDGVDDGEAPESLGSAKRMRDLRVRETGALLRLLADNPGLPVSSVTLLPRGWRVTVKELKHVDPPTLMAQLRSALNRCGAKDADGFIIGGLHAEYDPIQKFIRLHFHMIAGGGMIAVVERLRGMKRYALVGDGKPSRDEDGTDRVRISRKPLTNLPSTLAYILQPYWPQRWEGDGQDGAPKRGKKVRIDNPEHTQVLLWLDKWQPKDICLLMKLRVTKAGLAMRGIGSLYTNGGAA